MKKFIYSLAAVASMSLFGSCTDFLTEEVRGTENLETFFYTEDQVSQYVGGCYFQLTKLGGWWQVYNTWLMSDMTTDDMWDGNTTQDDGYAMTTHFYPTGQEQGILQNFWGARYQGIASCNLGLESFPKVTTVDESIMKRYIAEVRFLRAFFYFDLVRNFGGVPLVLHTFDDTMSIGRSTQEECYAFIEEELRLAAQDLPVSYDGANVGRATKGAALGILGKAQLYQAGNANKGKWTEAKNTLKQVMDLNVYELLPDFGDVWSPAHNNSKESLFESQQMYDGEVYLLGGSLTVVTGARMGPGDGWSWGQPSSDLENAFLAMGDTERLKYSIIKTNCTDIPGEDDFQQFIDNNASCGRFTSNKDQNPEESTTFQGYMNDFGWTVDDFYNTYLIDPSQHKSARIIRKYFCPTQYRPEVYNTDRIPLNHRILRYADVLLMYAEACAETGDNGSAQDALNQVRGRVGLAPVTATGTALIDAIRAERRLELCNEQCRLYDLRRWEMSDGRKMMEHVFGPNGTFVQYNLGPDADMYEAWNQIESSDKGIRFTAPRDLLYPIPLYEIQHSNGLITQNPGW